MLTPAFFSRKDTRTPVYGALVGLGFFAGFNILFVDRFGIVGLAAASAVGAWLNTLFLYVMLVRRDLYRMDGALVGQLLRQLAAAAVMVAVLYGLRAPLADWFGGAILERIGGVAALVLAGGLAYFGVAALDGAIDRARLQMFLKRKT